MAGPIPGLSPRDRTLVAHVARYHRGGIPDPARHPAFAALPIADRTLVEQLGAILRFADGLDRSHTDAVQDLRCELDGDRLIVTLLPGVGDEAERWAGQKKARWFEAVYGIRVIMIIVNFTLRVKFTIDKSLLSVLYSEVRCAFHLRSVRNSSNSTPMG